LSTQLPAPTTEIPPAVRAWTRLLRAHATTTRELNAQLQAEHGLTVNDYEALYVLSRNDDLRLKPVELAQRLLLTPSGITRLLDGLERSGLVSRAPCPADRRVLYAQLTEAGAARLEAASCSHVGSIRSLFEENMSTEEIDQLVDVLGKVPGVADDALPCEQEEETA
jgi:DNA-binding MarR family transcriptional regulator